MKLGGIKFADVFGGYELVNIPASRIPQDAATAVFGAINSGILGATYDPFWYVGSQVVNGKNHLFLCKEIRATANKDTSIVGLVINVPPSEQAFQGKDARVVNVIEEANLPDDLKCIFSCALQGLVGVGYKPLFYVGSQVVKGTNHYFICQAKGMYPGADPYAVLMCINVFDNRSSIVFIERIDDTAEEPKLGYSFTW